MLLQKENNGKIRPIGRFRVSKEVCAQLKRSILVGHLQPGDKLPSERDLDEEFQVSCVAIREALGTLENSGFIMTRQRANVGTYVTEFTFGHICNAFLDLFLADEISIAELYHVRLLIQPEIARLAASTVTPEYAQSLKEALQFEDLSTKSLWEDIGTQWQEGCEQKKYRFNCALPACR